MIILYSEYIYSKNQSNNNDIIELSFRPIRLRVGLWCLLGAPHTLPANSSWMEYLIFPLQWSLDIAAGKYVMVYLI